jgi:hypothetical protein
MSMIACTAASHLRYARINHSRRATGSCWKYALESTGFDPLVGSDGFDPLWSGPALRIIGPSAKQKIGPLLTINIGNERDDERRRLPSGYSIRCSFPNSVASSGLMFIVGLGLYIVY